MACITPRRHRLVHEYAKLVLTNENTFRGFSVGCTSYVGNVSETRRQGIVGMILMILLSFFTLAHRWMYFLNFFHIALSFKFLLYSLHQIQWYYRPIGPLTSVFA